MEGNVSAIRPAESQHKPVATASTTIRPINFHANPKIDSSSINMENVSPTIKKIVEKLEELTAIMGANYASLPLFYRYVRLLHLDRVRDDEAQPANVRQAANREFQKMTREDERLNALISNNHIATVAPLMELVQDLMQKTGVGDPSQIWTSEKFHLACRIRNIDELKLVLQDAKFDASMDVQRLVEKVQEAIGKGYDISIMPHNITLEPNNLAKYIPDNPEIYGSGNRYSLDPYGIFREMDKVVAYREIDVARLEKEHPSELEHIRQSHEIVEMNGKTYAKIYLATRKFDYAVLFNITETCPIGCAGCYKGSMVRTLETGLENEQDKLQLKMQLTLNRIRIVEQTRMLVQWLNQHPETDTVVISGGEPMMLGAEGMKAVFDELRKAGHVKVVRICTSAIYQGLSHRITEEFAAALEDFEKETGKQMYINAHVTDENQLLAPEALRAVGILEYHGITVHLQMPVQEGINFFRNDVEASAHKLKAILQGAYESGVIPYKFIVDMHSPSSENATVPIEVVSKVLGDLEWHMDHSDMAKPQVVNLLTPMGNFYIYPWPHLAAEKEVDAINREVRYYILKMKRGKSEGVYIYTEPLLKGLNDDPKSLPKPVGEGVEQLLKSARKEYGRFASEQRRIANEMLQIRDGQMMMEPAQKDAQLAELRAQSEQATQRLYTQCNIAFSQNEPLVISSQEYEDGIKYKLAV